jgi:putative salt-induced outer membrane protein
MKQILIAAAVSTVFASSCAFAQAPSGEWKGAVSIGASFAQGHVGGSTTNIGISADASRTTTADKTALYFTTVYGKSGDNTSAENIKVGGRYEWNLSPQAYAFGSLDFERDGIIDLNLRTAVGLGAGYYFVKSDPLTFTVFGGIGYRNDQYDGFTDNATELILGEESSHKLSDSMTFKQRLVFYPNLTESKEWRAAFDATLAVKLSDAWNMNLTLIDRFDNAQPAGARKNNVTFLIGVGSKFGK